MSHSKHLYFINIDPTIPHPPSAITVWAFARYQDNSNAKNCFCFYVHWWLISYCCNDSDTIDRDSDDKYDTLIIEMTMKPKLLFLIYQDYRIIYYKLLIVS
jgi:hypothetical protein